jgi:hypothetical protein
MGLFDPAGELFDHGYQFRPCSRIKTAGICRFTDIIGSGRSNLKDHHRAEPQKNHKKQTEHSLHTRISNIPTFYSDGIKRLPPIVIKYNGDELLSNKNKY